ncbi:tripartite motif-containing protein 2-like [Branchiostoma floridae x Branchiostoma belcheri]
MWPYFSAEDTDSSYSDDESVCGICQQTLRAPRTLSCRHVFCGACLDGLESKQSAPLKCPICESPAKQSAVSYIVRQPGKPVVGPSLVQARRKSLPKCSEHPKKRLALHCKQCEVVICKHCLEGSHKGHKTLSLLDLRSTENLQARLGKRVDSKQRTEDFLRNLETVEKSVTENHLQTKQSINDQYELWSKKLVERRDFLLREVDDNLEHNMAAIAREREIAQNQLEELNKIQAINGKEKKLADKSRSNMAIPVLLQPSTTRFEASDADPEVFNIGHVIIHRRDQEVEDGDKESNNYDEDDDLGYGCFDSISKKIPNFINWSSLND